MALDFGRVFLAWVSVNGMARVGANYAAAHPDAWSGLGNTTEQAEYQRQMRESGNVGSICGNPLPTPSFGPSRAIGESVRVDLTCNFPVITPIVQNIVGGTVRINGSSTFPITRGCIADCPPPPPSSTPPPAPSHCRTLPTLVGMSVQGAIRAWEAAGFLDDRVSTPTGTNDWDTVASQTVTPPPDGDVCESGKYFFSSSLSLTVTTPGPATTPGCRQLPNLLGMTVAEARAAWSSAGFTGTFTPPTGEDDQIVVVQATGQAAAPTPTIDPSASIDPSITPSPSPTPVPAASPGDCVDPATTTITVTYDAPPPAPPPAPCKVPSLVNTPSSTAQATWTNAGFTTTVTFLRSKQLPYTIRSQSLVGGTWVSCSSAMTVSDQ